MAPDSFHCRQWRYPLCICFARLLLLLLWNFEKVQACLLSSQSPEGLKDMSNQLRLRHGARALVRSRDNAIHIPRACSRRLGEPGPALRLISYVFVRFDIYMYIYIYIIYIHIYICRCFYAKHGYECREDSSIPQPPMPQGLSDSTT